MITCVFLRVVITELWEGLMKLKVKLTGAVSAIALSLTAVVAQADVLYTRVEDAQTIHEFDRLVLPCNLILQQHHSQKYVQILQPLESCFELRFQQNSSNIYQSVAVVGLYQP